MQRSSSILYVILRVILMFALLGIASVIGFVFRFIGFPETNLVIVYLLAVLLTAWLTNGFAYGILASVFATFLYNYFFTAPYFTLRVHDPSYLITFTIMTITAMITSTITSHAKKSALSAKEKESETKAVYHLTNKLVDACDMNEIADVAINVINDCFFCDAELIIYNENGIAEQSFISMQSSEKPIHKKTLDAAIILNPVKSHISAIIIDEEFYIWPIRGRESVLGIIRIPIEKAQVMSEAQNRLLRSMVETTALAMDRFRAAEQNIRSREAAVQEHFRGNLLRAISHDLRTPLSGIIGISEMLMDMTQKDDPRYSLSEYIHRDADWLHSLVENILSLTRLQDGKLTLAKQMEAVEEVIGGAVNHIAQRSPEYEISVKAPDELLLVPMDAKLIEQVIINLLDNAIKHTPPDGEICILVDTNDHYAVFTISDSGSGINEDDLPHIFEMFYTTHSRHADAQPGIGLGLAICDAIIKAHGGSITAENYADRSGAKFVFTLPMEEHK